MKASNKADTKEPTKILVNVWEWLIEKLNSKARLACLRRDEFLDLVLMHEAKMLVREIPVPNSPASRAYIAEHLGRLKRKQVNLNLSPETIQTIALACNRVNVPRDAFINRVFLLLVATRPAFQKLSGIDLKSAEQKILNCEWNYTGGPYIDGPLSCIEGVVRGDPFWFYRACIEVANQNIRKRQADGEDDLYEYDELHHVMIRNDFMTGEGAPESMVGFNCYVPDYEIQKESEGRPKHPSFEDLLGDVSITLTDPERRERS